MSPSIPNLVKVGLTTGNSALQRLILKVEENADDCVKHHLERLVEIEECLLNNPKYISSVHLCTL